MLMVAFYQIATMISPNGVSILFVLVLFGNVVVIALEGLSAESSPCVSITMSFSNTSWPTGTRYRPVSLESTEEGA